MKKMFCSLMIVCSLSSMAGLTVDTTTNAQGGSSASITITGLKAKKLIDYLSEVKQFSGSFVTEDAGMGKFYISGPGMTCRTTNPGHLEPVDRTPENLYRCEISFGEKGAVNL
jgi:hypothetical protein